MARRLAALVLTTLIALSFGHVIFNAGLDRMTDRERQVLVLLARGMSNTEIATRLHLSEATVRTHIGHLFAKIGARDRAQAVVFAYESGIVHAGDPTA